MSLGQDYFERMYSENPDPWNFATSPYESDKYSDTIASLKGKRFRSILEVGCSIGVLTSQLARVGDRVTAIDVSPRALDLARVRCRELTHVRFAESRIPEQAPAGLFDLIVLSEVAYYWTEPDLEKAKSVMLAQAVVDAHILLVHYTPFVESYPQTGDQVHTAFLNDSRFKHIEGHRAEQYRLDMLRVAA